MRLGIIDGDHWRGFSQPIAFMNANSDEGIPLGQFASQRRASGDEKLRAPAHPRPHFGINQTVSEFPRERLRSLPCKNLSLVVAANPEGPLINLSFGRSEER